MTKLLFTTLVATVALSACAPKGHKDEAKRPVTEQTAETPKPTESAPVESTKPQDSAKPQEQAKVEEQAKPEVTAKVEVPAAPKSEKAVVDTNPKSIVFGKDFLCKDEFIASFPAAQKPFADAADTLDKAIKAMQPVVDSLGDSSAHHTKVKAAYDELTSTYKSMLKEYGMTFGCFYMLPKGKQMTISSETFKAEYDQLRARVGKLIGTQHLGPEIKDI